MRQGMERQCEDLWGWAQSPEQNQSHLFNDSMKDDMITLILVCTLYQVSPDQALPRLNIKKLETFSLVFMCTAMYWVWMSFSGSGHWVLKTLFCWRSLKCCSKNYHWFSQRLYGLMSRFPQRHIKLKTFLYFCLLKFPSCGTKNEGKPV